MGVNSGHGRTARSLSFPFGQANNPRRLVKSWRRFLHTFACAVHSCLPDPRGTLGSSCSSDIIPLYGLTVILYRRDGHFSGSHRDGNYTHLRSSSCQSQLCRCGWLCPSSPGNRLFRGNESHPFIHPNNSRSSHIWFWRIADKTYKSIRIHGHIQYRQHTLTNGATRLNCHTLLLHGQTVGTARVMLDVGPPTAGESDESGYSLRKSPGFTGIVVTEEAMNGHTQANSVVGKRQIRRMTAITTVNPI